MPKPTPAALVATRFGGHTRLADLLKVHRSTTWRWLQRGRVPVKEVPRLLALARKQRITLTESEILMGRAG